MRLSEAFQTEVISVVGRDAFELRQDPLREWTTNTLDSPRTLTGIVKPKSQEETMAVVRLCVKHKVPYYPVSSGKNWGYGGATPVCDDVLILDLSGLKRIIEFNADLSYVVVEPGVTQQDLYEYMQLRNHSFMVPTTGAGPNVSLMGNAMERGYGITPEEDHFLSVLALKAILPDGRLYQSALSELGGAYSDKVFKWKIGPYLDGLFAQSNLGVVLEATLGLVHQPENVTQFVVFLDDEEFETGVHAVKTLRQKLGGLLGGVNLMNKRRLLAMVDDQWSQEKTLDEIRVIEHAKKNGVPDWAIVGALYGPNDLVQGANRIIKTECRHFSRKVVCLSRRKYEWANRLLKHLPFKKLKMQLANVGRALEILEGKPSNVALPLAYLKNKKGHPVGELNPDKDDCGLLWFSPLVPMDAPVVRDYVQEVTEICLAHEIDPMITLTAFSSRCFDSTIPILFSKQVAGDAENAKKCYEKLLKECSRMGFFPYRLNIDQMNGLFENPNVPAFWMAQQIKNALDPDHLMAPGRYIHHRKP